MSHCAGNLTAELEGSLHVALHSSHCPVTYNAPVTDGTGGKFIIMEDKQKKHTKPWTKTFQSFRILGCTEYILSSSFSLFNGL